MSATTMACFIAELINGGDWDDPNFYTEEQKELWRKHAEEIERQIRFRMFYSPYRQGYELPTVVHQGEPDKIWGWGRDPVEAKEFVVNPQHYSDGAVIRQVNDDGTVIEISAEEFWERARGDQKESGE